MLFASFLASSLAVGIVIASPIEKRDLKPYNPEIQIHSSCNVTQRRVLEKALADTYELASFAKEYVATNGPDDSVFQLYFGNHSANYPAVLGAWDGLLIGNKEGVLLRCDDIDGNCHQEGWRGHWRGSNATTETVICDASYTDRYFNEYFCLNNYTVIDSSPSFYWSTDLIHRMYHVPGISDDSVTHHADSYEECLELAHHNASLAPYNTHTLQYFASHVYAVEIAKGGAACIGSTPDSHGHSQDHDHDQVSSVAPASSTLAIAPVATSASPPSTTSSAAESCHTHAGGELHCV